MGAELLEWVAHLGMAGGMEASGMWLILGGMGLAAASNSAHLPKLTQSNTTDDCATQEAERAAENSAANPKETTPTGNVGPSQSASITEQSQDDSISFKVRLPWR